jgi:hypothetical protein
MLDLLTQLAFASAFFLIRTFVHLCGSELARKGYARPPPDGWREGPAGQPWASWYSRVERAPDRQNASTGCGRSAISVRNAATSSGDW